MGTSRCAFNVTFDFSRTSRNTLSNLETKLRYQPTQPELQSICFLGYWWLRNKDNASHGSWMHHQRRWRHRGNHPCMWIVSGMRLGKNFWRVTALMSAPVQRTTDSELMRTRGIRLFNRSPCPALRANPFFPKLRIWFADLCSCVPVFLPSCLRVPLPALDVLAIVGSISATPIRQTQELIRAEDTVRWEVGVWLGRHIYQMISQVSQSENSQQKQKSVCK